MIRRANGVRAGRDLESRVLTAHLAQVVAVNEFTHPTREASEGDAGPLPVLVGAGR